MLPTSLKRIFWDTDLANIDREANKSYVLSRILELEDDGSYAQPPQLNPMRKTVKKAKMRSVGFMSGM